MEISEGKEILEWITAQTRLKLLNAHTENTEDIKVSHNTTGWSW
jgi:hypothetical protein